MKRSTPRGDPSSWCGKIANHRLSSLGQWSVERVHRTQNVVLFKVVPKSQLDCAERLPMVVAAYNAAQHEKTEYSPYDLMFGREYRTSLDLTLKLLEEMTSTDMGEYATQLRDRIQCVYQVVNRHLKPKTHRMKTRHDAKAHSFQMEPGDYFLYYCSWRKRGRYQKWRRLCSIRSMENRFHDILYIIYALRRVTNLFRHI